MAIDVYTDEYFMRMAYQEAQKAFDLGEVPIGAVVVYGGKKIIARAHNQTEQLTDVTAHAEMLAITAAANYIGAKYLHDCALYVTLEPCIMCAGALAWSQIDKIVFAAQDERKGFNTQGKNILHPKTEVRYGPMETECSSLIRRFFAERRN